MNKLSTIDIHVVAYKSHAASFALLVYVSAWLKCYYPAAFCAALINSQPMGFYAPAQLVREAQRQGVHVLPVCINRSDSEADLERHDDEIALRLGFNQISGLAAADHEELVAARRLGGAFDSVADCAKRAGLGPGALERLARADAFAGLGLSRRQALWAVRALAPESRAAALPLFAHRGLDVLPPEDEHAAALPALPPGMPPPLDRTLILPVSKGLSRIRSPCAVGFTALTMCAMA